MDPINSVRLSNNSLRSYQSTDDSLQKGQINHSLNSSFKSNSLEPLLQHNNLFDTFENSTQTPYIPTNNFPSPNLFDTTIAPANPLRVIPPKQAVELKKLGNKFKQEKNYTEAVKSYKQALRLFPQYADVYYNLGNLYKDIKDHKSAIQNFKTLVTIAPRDIEGWTLLGQLYQREKLFDNAKSAYNQALHVNPLYDFAKRSLISLEIDLLSLSDPNKALELKEKIGQENIQTALAYLKKNAKPEILANLKNLSFEIKQISENETEINLAQYEHFTNKILISETLRYASPEVIAAYIVHESVHAKDKDNVTSIQEEQDAFLELTKFWLPFNNGISDPDLNLIVKLYQQGKQCLDEKVAEIYKQRYPNIQNVSPGHGQAFSPNDNLLAKLYDTIKGNAAPLLNDSIIIQDSTSKLSSAR